jgi:hypothetical protein
MSNSPLRSRLIRLAHADRTLRPQLLRMLSADWNPGLHTDQGWEQGSVEEAEELPGEGSQVPPARDGDGKLLSMKEATSPGVTQIEMQPMKEGNAEHVRVSIYEAKGKLHKDIKLGGLASYLTKDLLMPKRTAEHIAGMMGNLARVRVERRGEKWGRVQVIR